VFAGKSNVMDAICFVLGLPSKSIRADKFKDLIFRVEGKPEEGQVSPLSRRVPSPARAFAFEPTPSRKRSRARPPRPAARPAARCGGF
jgi:hypothetical protein